MLERHRISRIAATLLVLLAIVSTGVAAPNSCVDLRLLDMKSECVDSRSCCCRAAAPTSVCCCDREEGAPGSVPALPDDPWRIIKWMPQINVLPPFLVGLSALSASLPSRRFGLASGRSVQSLLCVWRN